MESKTKQAGVLVAFAVTVASLSRGLGEWCAPTLGMGIVPTWSPPRSSLQPEALRCLS
jgi:hypothetical protein